MRFPLRRCFLFGLLLLCNAYPAHALPAFARQTGEACADCHVGSFGPQLTPHGMKFKLTGYADGKLTGVKIGADGTLTASYSNGTTQSAGQLALASFRNNQGLVDKGSNTFEEGPNSGTAVISAPGE